MVSVLLGEDRTRYADRRMGDWKWRLWIGGGYWFVRAGCVRQCWPYRYYYIHLGRVELVLKYAPECRLCLNDEHILYPGKYCQGCYGVMYQVREVVVQ